MTRPLDLDTVLTCLREALRQDARHQRRDPQAADDGARISDQHGMDELGHTGTARLVAGAVLSWVCDGSPEDLDIATRGAAAIRRLRRPSGRIDLRSCNVDGDADTAFMLRLLLRCLDLLPSRQDACPALLEDLRTICAEAGRCLLDGGVHTPNHRWVMAAALAQTARHFPDLDAASAARRWMAETPDLNADGLFLERSVGVYDAVSDSSLLLVDEHLGWPEGRAAALANLRANLMLLNGDGSAETILSTRQDHGTRTVPSSLIPSYMRAWRLTGDRELGATAAWLWHQATDSRLDTLFWIAAELVLGGPLDLPPADRLAERRQAWWPTVGLWRLRHGDFACSVCGQGERLLTLTWGSNAIAGLGIAHAYFGHGRFVTDSMVPDEQGVCLTSRGHLPPYRLGYSLALDRPIPPEEWDRTWAERGLSPRPPCQASLRVDPAPEAETGVDLHLHSATAPDDVPVQIAFDLPLGGRWQSAGGCMWPREGQVFMLQAGSGCYVHDGYRISIGPGTCGHHYQRMRDTTAPPPACWRLIIPLRTPVDHHLAIRCTIGP